MNIQELAAQYRQCFEERTRLNGEKFWSWKDTLETPLKARLQSLVYRWHDGMLPNDNRYQMIVELLELIQKTEDLSQVWDELRHCLETKSQEDNVKWLAESVYARSYIDDQDQAGCFWTILASARLQEYEEALQMILSSLEVATK